MKYIAIDLGSTYTKIADIIDGTVQNLYKERTPAKLGNDPDRYEIDGNDYFQSVYTLINKHITFDTIGILFSTQMHGYLLTDSKFSPVTPYISWQDRQGALYIDNVRKKLGVDCTIPAGVPLKGNLALCSLMSRIDKGMTISNGLLFNTLGGYIIGRLTGKHTCHLTNAAPSGLVDILNRCWNYELIKQSGLDKLTFPAIENSISSVGRFHGIPVYPDIGDQQMCALGANLKTDNTLHVNIGTAGLIGYLTETYLTGEFETRPWVTTDKYLLTVSGLPGGRNLYKTNVLLQELVEKITGVNPGENAVWRFLASAEDSTPASSLNELFASPVKKFVPTVLNTFSEAYLSAASKIPVNIGSLAFSGGCTEKNPILREAIKCAFAVNDNGHSYDVMQGMIKLTKLIGDTNI